MIPTLAITIAVILTGASAALLMWMLWHIFKEIKIFFGFARPMRNLGAKVVCLPQLSAIVGATEAEDKRSKKTKVDWDVNGE